MAHLKRCWCGKVYRCEQIHVRKSCCSFEEMGWVHDKCPDFSLHGPKEIKINTVLELPKIQTVEQWPAMSIALIIEANPLKGT